MKKQGEVMIKFEYLNKSEFTKYSQEIFKILADNMSVIVPTGNTIEEDYNYWIENRRNVLKCEERQIILIKDDEEIIGFFQYSTKVEKIVCFSSDNSIHAMKICPSAFDKIKSGQKTIELRLCDNKCQKIKVRDMIDFTNTSNGKQLRTKVKKLHCFNNFEELYKTLPLLQCGYTSDDITQAKPSDMEQYYSVEEQKKYGVVGIELFPANRNSYSTFMMEEIQFKKEYQGKGIFRKLYSFIFENIDNNIDFVEAYANKQNKKSICILKRIGLSEIGTNKSGRCLHFKGNFSDMLKWFKMK